MYYTMVAKRVIKEITMKNSNAEKALHSSKAEVSGELSETRNRLLKAAEELFARKGFDGTSIRELVTRAGCKNISAVNYYFGDKQELYEELFRDRLREMRKSRLEAIEAVMDKKNKPTLEKLLLAYAEDFLKPFKSIRRSQRFMQLFFREMAEQRLPKDMFLDEMAAPVMTVMENALATLYPNLSRHDIQMSCFSVTGQLVHIMQVRVLFEGAHGHSIASIDIDDAINHIVKFSAAAIRGLEKGS
jgi:TetR/AcrR family transcriptional regulator, regulator of cefoperazone and chloramphenicol sensitivity